MEVIGRLRHENVGDVRAYYFSRDHKILVYDYYQDSVSALLHGKNSPAWKPLDWENRLKIAVSTARGIAHIHRRDGRKLVHGNITSSNIFLNRQNQGIVFYAALGTLTSTVKLPTVLNSGYNAPKVTNTRKVSQASDVYSFGVVLLELVSGKKPEHTTDDGKVISLVDWVQSVFYNEWSTKVFDLDLWKYQNEETMMQLLQLAMDCVAIFAERRPRIPEVVKILEEISSVDPSDESSSEDVLEDTRGKSSIESRLEDLLEDLLPNLTS